MISRKRQLNSNSFESGSVGNDASDQERSSQNETHTHKKAKPGIVATLYSLDATKYPNIQLSNNRSMVSLGRSKKRNDFILSEADCSSIHCQMSVSINQINNTEYISVKDLSSNGTFLNDVLIGKENNSMVRDGDKLSFASSLHYILKYTCSDKQFKRASFFDHYILTSKVLGTGHYAQVKEAVNRESGEICAVKIFHPTTSKKNDSTQLDRELDILTKLNHPNIVGFYSTFVEPVNEFSINTYLVLEKVNGGELFNRIVKKGKLNVNESKAIITQLLKGLSYLHSMDIVHRDLKPENILLSIENGDQNEPWDFNEANVTVKIADFGLAKFIGKFQFTNTLCGTPAYVAPEVLVNQQQRKYNKAVDMWSVGVLLYVCLCGFPPFSEELGPPTMRQQIIQGKYAFYSPYWDDIEDVVLDLISRLLVVDPVNRLSVEHTLQHPWICPNINSLIESCERITTESIGHDCEPITIKERVETGLTDDIIAQKYCNNKSEKGNVDDGDLSMSND